eukprot:m.24593 g.24593  ORF g.24593 m.24593 type:complete len:502 (-) comp14670_c0_seq1:177-1682(-)
MSRSSQPVSFPDPFNTSKSIPSCTRIEEKKEKKTLIKVHQLSDTNFENMFHPSHFTLSLLRSASRPTSARLVSLSTKRSFSATRTVSNVAVDGDVRDVVIVGGGAAGISVAASLKSRDKNLDITIIDPADVHYYQPGWTMVGNGIFTPEQTVQSMASLIPKGVHWVRAAVTNLAPQDDQVVLDGARVMKYKRLIMAPGLKLNWEGIDGLVDTLGQNGVTSNYRFDLAPYTWDLVKNLKNGRALFTQPPMPIKCAGAPQKAMYLSADHWLQSGVLKDIAIEFYNSGGVLFGVKEYVPALMEYIEKYRVDLNFMHTLTRVDGPSKTAYFTKVDADGTSSEVVEKFDMLHVVPPQIAPDFVRESALADAGGWVDVDQSTLRHKTFSNVWSLGDVTNTPNAKTAAAARVQAPIVANNIMADIKNSSAVAQYNGYGSCPLTVERGKIVLAEFGYGGALLPSFPKWILDGTKPTRSAWILKEQILPVMYWKGMLRGHEVMVKPVIGK